MNKKENLLPPLEQREEVKEHKIHQAVLNTVTRITSGHYKKPASSTKKVCAVQITDIYRKPRGITDHAHTMWLIKDEVRRSKPKPKEIKFRIKSGNISLQSKRA